MLFLSVVLIIAAFTSAEPPCQKLNVFGNNIQNKAVLSPLIIVGQSGMKIPLGTEAFKMTIDIKHIIKGSLGDWKKNIIIAGDFTTKNDSRDLCTFLSSTNENRIYFLQVSMTQNGEYRVLFGSEKPTRENIKIVNDTICIGCAEAPKILIKDNDESGDKLRLDCVSESIPTPIIKWTNSQGNKNIKVAEIRNGSRLMVLTRKNIVNTMFTCVAANVLGDTTSNVIIREGISRCARKDQLLCNGHGKCYQDKIDGDSEFCRCDQGFTGSFCASSAKNDKYAIRTPSADVTHCNKNGEAYMNVSINRLLCLCHSGFYGSNCSQTISIQFNKENAMLRNINKNDWKKDKEKSEIKKLIYRTTSKVEMNHIIIVCAMVLVCVIVVILVIVLLWKCFATQRFRHVLENRNEKATTFERNHQSNGHSMLPISRFEDGLVLLPGNTEMSKVPTSPKSTIRPSENQTIHNYDQFSGNGIYEGVSVSLTTNGASPRHVNF